MKGNHVKNIKESMKISFHQIENISNKGHYEKEQNINSGIENITKTFNRECQQCI